MAKLNWEYDARDNRQRASYRGLTLEAVSDPYAENPFQAWDNEPPTAVFSGRHRDGSDYSGGAVLDPLSHISDGRLRLRKNWEAAARALDLDPAAFRAECESDAADYGDSLVDTMREKLQETLDGLRPSYYQGAADYTAALAALWQLAGFAALDWTSQGYSQGDYAEGISVATPEWIEATGAPAASHAEQLEAARNLWGAWAWGDSYGFIIKGPNGADLDAIDALDSCFGYYGSDHAESGLEAAAKESARHIIATARAAREKALKRLARNRVPLDLRPEILRDAAGSLAPLFDREGAE